MTQSKLTKKQIKENRIAEIKEELKTLIEEKGTTVYTRLLHVSKSGMMRSIKVYLSDMTEITDEIAEIQGYTFHKTGGLKVTGCGMDMGFSVVYNLSSHLYNESFVDEYGRERSAGYRLTHRWL